MNKGPYGQMPQGRRMGGMGGFGGGFQGQFGGPMNARPIPRGGMGQQGSQPMPGLGSAGFLGQFRGPVPAQPAEGFTAQIAQMGPQTLGGGLQPGPAQPAPTPVQQFDPTMRQRQEPDPYAGMTGSEIFARLFQRP